MDDAETIDAKDFKIHNLERMVSDRDEEIARLRDRIANARYFAITAKDWIVKAIDGEMKKPILTDARD